MQLRLRRPIREKPNISLPFAALVTKPGEKTGLASSIDRLDGSFHMSLTEHAIGSRTEPGASTFDVVEVAPRGTSDV